MFFGSQNKLQLAEIDVKEMCEMGSTIRTMSVVNHGNLGLTHILNKKTMTQKEGGW